MSTDTLLNIFSKWRLLGVAPLNYHARVSARAVGWTAVFLALILITGVTSHRYISTMVSHDIANVNIRVFLALLAGTWGGTAIFAEVVNMLFISKALMVHDEKILASLMKRRVFAEWLRIDYIIPRAMWCTAASVMLVGVRDGGYGPFTGMSLLWGPVAILLVFSMLFYGLSILSLISASLDMGIRNDRHK